MRRLLTSAVLFVALAAFGHAQTEATLSAVYRSILLGDYEQGRAALGRLAENPDSRQVALTRDWLDSFLRMSAARDQSRQGTFDWNVKSGKEALEQGRVYVALSFAAQATPYAPDDKAYAADPWIQALRQRALEEAQGWLDKEKWGRAVNYYHLLLRINERDQVVKAARDRCFRHLRLQHWYRNKEEIERRLEGVTEGMLNTALGQIAENYYSEPDFRAMAEGALDYLIALCHTTKLYDASSVFDGIADPLAREHFLSRLEELRKEVLGRDTFGARQLGELYKAAADANRQTVSLPKEMVVVEFLEGALSRLDEFTSVVWPADGLDFNKMMMGTFFGVGIQLGVDEITGRLKVVTPLENSPALEAGIQPDDLIVEVDGVSTKDWTTDKAVREITGEEEGKIVTLTIYRPRTGQTLRYPLRRSRIQITTVRGVKRLDQKGDRWDYLLDPQVGAAYMKLTGFNPDSHEELERALANAKKQGMRGLVLDLRNNPGGLLDVAINVVSKFLDEGEVVWTKGRREARQEHSVDGDATFAGLPLVVLVNESSASASEILAGALQDHGRALVVGERTFGKGSVQRVLALDRRMFAAPKARLKLTTALYYLPSNRSPQRLPDAEQWGVDPDWKVTLTPKEFGKVMEREREAFVIHNEDQTSQPVDEQERQKQVEALKAPAPAEEGDDAPEEELLTAEEIQKLRFGDPTQVSDFDPQLETALLHLRVKLAADLPWPRLARKPVQTAQP